MAFSQKNRTPLASIDLEAFNPIPLPFVAYVATAVSQIPLNYIVLTAASPQLLNGLEEFKTGVEVTRDFSGPGYADYYTIPNGKHQTYGRKGRMDISPHGYPTTYFQLWAVRTDNVFSALGGAQHFRVLDLFFLLMIVMPS